MAARVSRQRYGGARRMGNVMDTSSAFDTDGSVLLVFHSGNGGPGLLLFHYGPDTRLSPSHRHRIYDMLFESLPVDLIAEILGELDLESLIKMSNLSKRFQLVASDASLNPWRRPIIRNLRTHAYEKALKHLSVRTSVPRQNWVEIISLARPSFILFEATLPNLKESDWEECFRRRFLPGWRKWRKDSRWKEAFLKMLHRVWHRSVTMCTADEAWTKYIVLNRNGSANELEVSSRNYNPFNAFNEMKLQNDLSNLETRIRVVVELADVRILAFGTLAKPRSHFLVNPNAHIFLNPPGVSDKGHVNFFSKMAAKQKGFSLIDDHGVYPMSNAAIPAYLFREYSSPTTSYTRMTYPQPAPTHANYPFFTPGGGDARWIEQDEIEQEGLHWVGAMMIVAQLICPAEEDGNGVGRHFASFTWSDLWVVSPWIEEKITKKITGAGLGN
ncbi:unnamed protein product [Cyclocybe aegerita]|uniref:F-box domain-containing protein n=1 Tax=Cyclocybe aegerita TaxID=1973307 RepID=A0A8S0W7D8_CYCAE|nr:unnamed protein product [Cyclocybe aegerita]